MILPMLAVPFATALVVWFFRHLRAAAATLAVAGVLTLALLALSGSGEPPLIVLGRTLDLNEGLRLHLALALGLLAVALAATARLPEQESAWTLALLGLGMLVAFAALRTLLLATLVLQTALALLALLIPFRPGDLAPVQTRALVAVVLAGMLAVAAAWLAERPAGVMEGLPAYLAPTALAVAYGAMLGAFPFFVWQVPVYRSPSILAPVVLGAVLPQLLIVRLLTVDGPALAPAAVPVQVALLNMGIATFVVGCVGAVAQQTAGGLLGYMAMSELGVVLMGIGSGTPGTRALAMAHLLSRGIGIVAMSVAIAVMRQCFGGDAFTELRGAIRRAPLTCLALLLAGFSLAGMPPLAGFVTRFALYRAIAIEGLGWATSLVAFGVVPWVGVTRLAVEMFQVAPAPGSRRESLWPASLALSLGLLALLWGLFPQVAGYLPPAWSELLLGLGGS